jgi:hypothetical protein
MFSLYIRSLQPKGIDVSIGGEIGEVGGTQLYRGRAAGLSWMDFTKNYHKTAILQIDKISIRLHIAWWGSLPDGSIAKVNFLEYC